MSLDTIKDALQYYSDTESWPTAKPVIEGLLKAHSEADIIGEMAMLSQSTKKQWKAATLRWRMEQPQQQPQQPQEAQRAVTPFGLEMSRFCQKMLKATQPYRLNGGAPAQVMLPLYEEQVAILRKYGKVTQEEIDRLERVRREEKEQTNEPNKQRDHKA